MKFELRPSTWMSSFREKHLPKCNVEEEHAISDEFVCITIDSTHKIYIPSNNQEASVQTYTYIFS